MRCLIEEEKFVYVKAFWECEMKWRKSSEAGVFWAASPGEGIVGAATERTDMQSVFPMVTGGIVVDVPLDADLLTI